MKEKLISEPGRFNFFLTGINILILVEHYLGRQLYPVNTPGQELSWLILPALSALSLLVNLFTVRLITASGEGRICLREPFTLRGNARSVYTGISVLNLLVSGVAVFCMIGARAWIMLPVPGFKILFVLLALCDLPRLIRAAESR